MNAQDDIFIKQQRRISPRRLNTAEQKIKRTCFVVAWLVLKSLSSCFKLWISFKMQIKLLLGGTEEGRRGLCLTSLLTKEAVSCILHGS